MADNDIAKKVEGDIAAERGPQTTHIWVRVAEDDIHSMFFGSGTLVRINNGGETLTSLPTEWKFTGAGYSTANGPGCAVVTISFTQPGKSDGGATQYRFEPN